MQPNKKKTNENNVFFFAQCVRVTTKHYWHRRHTQKKIVYNSNYQCYVVYILLLYTIEHNIHETTTTTTELPNFLPWNPPQKKPNEPFSKNNTVWWYKCNVVDVTLNVVTNFIYIHNHRSTKCCWILMFFTETKKIIIYRIKKCPAIQFKNWPKIWTWHTVWNSLARDFNFKRKKKCMNYEKYMTKYEKKTNYRSQHDEEFANILNAFWLTAITFLCVGYGDIVPNTYCGRGITLTCGMVVSILQFIPTETRTKKQ